jgi:hypothetical protein
LVLEQKFVLPGYSKSYPRNPEWTCIWPFTYISRSNQGHNAYFYLKMSNLLYVVIIKLIIIMNDRLNTSYEIHVWDLTFISRSYLGQKPVKTANSLKNLLQNHKCQGWKKSSFIISMRSSSLLRQFPVTDIFWLCFWKAKVLKMTISMLNNLFSFCFRSKNSIARVSYTHGIRKCTHVWPLTYSSRSNQDHDAYFIFKYIPLFCINDRLNTCYKIHVQDLTLTFISRSYLGQHPLKLANC